MKTINLHNGVDLHIIDAPKFKTNLMSVYINIPLERETVTKAALLPSVLKRGCTKYPTIKELSHRLDELYGATLGTLVRLRGETKLTGFYADFIEEAFLPAGEAVFAPMVEFFRDILFHPALENGLLNARYVESEKQNLIHAIESAQNDKRVYAAMRMRRIMCEGEAASIPRLGYAEDVAAIIAHQECIALGVRLGDIVCQKTFPGEFQCLVLGSQGRFQRGYLGEGFRLYGCVCRRAHQNIAYVEEVGATVHAL